MKSSIHGGTSMFAQISGDIKFLRLPQVKERTGLSRSTIYLMMKNGQFPKPIKIVGKSVAWVDRDVTDWQMQRLSGVQA
jgi:prophage regulatory protein